MTRLIDLSQTIEAGMITYPAAPGPVITDHLSRVESRSRYEPGTEFLIGRVDMIGNTGTYLDTPFHCYEDGFDLDGLALEDVADLSRGSKCGGAPSSSTPVGTVTGGRNVRGARPSLSRQL